MASQIAKLAFEQFAKSEKPPSKFSLDLAGRRWRVVPDRQGNIKRWFASQFLDLYQDNHAVYYRVEETAWSKCKQLLFGRKAFNLGFGKLEQAEREQASLLEKEASWGSFQDPFTQLASLAFQSYEPDFTNKDFASPEDCRYRILLDEGAFKLVPKEDARLSKQANQGTLRSYRNHLYKQFGKTKIRLIEARYGLNLKEMIKKGESLTPEHVYRFNIGVNDIETRDLESLLRRILDGKKLFSREKGKVRAKMKKRLLEATEGGKKRALSTLPPDAFQMLMQVYELDKKTAARSLTGREIYSAIQSAYTMADHGERKPWVDQQEVFQTVQKMKGRRDPLYFFEKASHVLVKKHLEKPGLNGEMSVGALIPAPAVKGSPQRWYKVSSCVSNGFGIYSYTLESACDDPSLEKIKLYRSTASVNAAFRSGESVLNDLNCIRSPGYAGMGLADLYEKEFIEASTIPSWVAYTALAKKQLQEGKELKEVQESLLKANQLFEKHLESQTKILSLKELIQKNDGIINWVHNLTRLEYYRARFKRKTPYPPTLSSYDKLLNYVRGGKTDEKSIAESLKKELEQIASKFEKEERYPAMRGLIEELIGELNSHVLEPQKREKKLEDQLKTFAGYSTKPLDEENLKAWIKKLERTANDSGEGIESKEKRSLAYTGHSLGGACAQAHLVYYHVKGERVPLPGCGLSAYLFDDPAIEKEDNRLFKAWGKEHAGLFKELGIQIKLNRWQEAGDFVPLGGEEHLAAAENEEEEQELLSWLDCKISVLRRLNEAKSKAIQESPSAHATQFSSGKKDRDYLETKVSPLDQGIFDAKGLRDPIRWLKLREKVWKLPLFSARMDGNRIRTNPFLSLFVFWWKELDKETISFELDEKGIFAVDEGGYMQVQPTLNA